ncbi:uncharacterized protein LOC116004818 [Ipomoea triloba]|uniref:uncharacterized protein LOC116004818 n=1 Tax=Ipomoea triloba TaxID=35885 RepID=UPI00125D2BD5|nr:uncharacterized protein LOC116004818 [Ipomoea triloba]
MNLLFWNIRGLLSSCRRLKRLIRHESIHLSAIFEPFLTNDKLDSYIRTLNLHKGFASSVSKIWILWSSSFNVEVLIDCDQFVYCKASFIPWNFDFEFVAVYAKHTRTDRQILWSQLNAIIEESSSPLLLGGDFNVISSVAEYKGNATPELNSISDFSTFIADNSLLDLATTGGTFTWTGTRNRGRIWKRLDRFLLSSSFRDYFTDVNIMLLNRTTSDHAPILLCGNKADLLGPKQFRFQNMWLKHASFEHFVKTNWSVPAIGGGMRALTFKLKRLKQALRVWNREIFGNVFDQVRNLDQSVSDAEKRFDASPTQENRELLSYAQASLLQALKLEEIYWKQKARVKWLREGDANTSFFHSTVKDRHRRQRISAVKNTSGSLLTNQVDIQSEAVNFFTSLFTADESEDMHAILDCLPTILTTEDNIALLAPLTREEVKNAVWALDPDSTAGPDGFSGSFFRSCWDILHNDVYIAVLDFMIGVPVPFAFSSAQLVLIPKKLNPESFADYRPICLCTFVSKIFTKVISTRLNKLLPRIISREQSGFVQGRNIHDNVLLALELIQSINKRCQGSNVAIKLDMSKAFDRVAWPFLRAVLQRFGFSTYFINLIMNFLNATRLSVLVNGVSCGFFKPSRGVKQGDPLSPLLFILVSEALSRSLLLHYGSGLISPYETSFRCPIITHLGFADDIIIFANGGVNSLRNLSKVLKIYQQASGQKINSDKSFFITSKHCNLNRITAMEEILDMKRSSLPFRYLGVNIFQGRNKIIFYQHILENVNNKLQGWQRKLLSPGGRLVLIKHVLTTIPLYTIAAVQLPRQVIKELERKFARFFWGTYEGKQKFHWASWEKICLPTDEGGLGIHNLTSIQQACSAKLWFNFKNKDSLWSEFMKARYSTSSVRRNGSIVWRRMFQLADLVDENSGVIDNETIWKPSTKGDFTLSTAYDLIRPRKGSTLSSKCIWAPGLSTKCSIFMWKLFRKFLSFPDCLERFGICLPSICPFCLNASASLEHCLYSCTHIYGVWQTFAVMFGISLNNARSIRAACHTWWLSTQPGTASGFYCSIFPCLILWVVWTLYNAALYEDSPFTLVAAISKIKRETMLISLIHPIRRSSSSDYFLVHEGIVSSFSPNQRIRITWIKWQKPPSGRLKLNTDAFFSFNGAAGGACLRNSEGILIAGLSFPLIASSALEAEALALDFALSWCELASMIPAHIEVDSIVLVRFATSITNLLPWRIRSAVKHIHSRITSWSSSIIHVYREGNRVADALALEGLHRTSATLFSSFNSLPDKVKLALLYDFRGFAASRSFRY